MRFDMLKLIKEMKGANLNNRLFHKGLFLERDEVVS
jgi:hypothetical protein